MLRDLPSTGDTQAISLEQPHGFVDSCIALIETLLEARAIPAGIPEPAKPLAGD
jgi:hypothetical protein